MNLPDLLAKAKVCITATDKFGGYSSRDAENFRDAASPDVVARLCEIVLAIGEAFPGPLTDSGECNFCLWMTNENPPPFYVHEPGCLILEIKELCE